MLLFTRREIIHMGNLTILLNGTPERFRPTAEQVLPSFIKLFEDYVSQITPLMERDHAMRRQNADGSLSEQIGALEEESKSVKDRLLKGHITNNIYVSPFDTVPSTFAYFHTGGTLHFTIKTAKKITIHISFTDEDGNDTYHRFILRPAEGRWLIDWFGYSCEGEEGPFKKYDL